MLSKLFPDNVDPVDRAVGVVIGLGLLSLTVIGPHTLWGLIGVVPLATAFIGSCALYTLFGVSTCKAADRARAQLSPARDLREREPLSPCLRPSGGWWADCISPPHACARDLGNEAGRHRGNRRDHR